MPPAPAYQVLARKYRPQTFADLIGQDVMVRTLKNAFAADRVAHAFVLTGVRGVGKTTTARIVAKGLNCTGTDGSGGMTIEPCGACASCRAIADGRSVDVMEYDAASHTKVEEMRDILASLPYRPAEARFKVIIFDEVHMLSPGSFNALLKTLEEPPEHVKFIFATTEIRKVPVTILSRCQRFDLRRIEPEAMTVHLRGILEREGAAMEPEALALIVRAAEGSVRDALSLMDQAIAHGAGATDVAQVRAMLGLADRGRVLDLFDAIMKGDAPGALAELSAQYAAGGDPGAILRDLAEVTHWVSVVKIAPEAAEDTGVPPDERQRGSEMARNLPLRVLSRMWQMLLKALEEVVVAPNAMMAAEMAVIRLTHVADLPDPQTLLRRLSDGNLRPGGAVGASGDDRSRSHAPVPASGVKGLSNEGSAAPSGDRPGTRHETRPETRPETGPGAPLSGGGARLAAGGGVSVQAAPSPAAALAGFQTFGALIDLIRERRDMKLLVEVENGLRLVAFAPGRIEFEPTPDAPRDLAASLSQRLAQWTGVRWAVSVVSSGGAATIAERRAAEADAAVAGARANPLVAAIFDAFPSARIAQVRPLDIGPGGPGAATAIPGDDADGDAGQRAGGQDDYGPDDWDPFDDD
jgi:DNA polymerase-3 subunit gamma/tau